MLSLEESPRPSKRTMPSARLTLNTDTNNNHSNQHQNKRSKMQLANHNLHPKSTTKLLNGFHKSPTALLQHPPDNDTQQPNSPPSLDVWDTLTAKIPLVVSNGRSSVGSMKAKRAPPTVDAMDIGPAQTTPAEATHGLSGEPEATQVHGPKRKKQATSETAVSSLRSSNLAILECDDESLVRTAIKKMPATQVPDLMSELQRGLFRSGPHIDKYLRCLSILLEEKFTFLTMTNLAQYQALKQLLAARTTLLDGCLRLKGRLDLLLSHTTKPELKNIRQTAKQTYESDSEEESEEEDEEEDEELRMNGDDENHVDLDDDDMDEEMFGSEDEDDEEDEEGEDAAAEADDDSAAEADVDDGVDDDDDELEDDDDDDEDD